MARDVRSSSRPVGRSKSGSSRASSRPSLGTATRGRSTSRAVKPKRRPRSLRRMTILGALVVFLAVIITPTLHTYLQRKSQIQHLTEKVASQRQDVASKKAQLQKWKSDAYVRKQVQKRLGFAKPGQPLTVVVDKQNLPHHVKTTGNGVSVKLPWYGKIWQSTLNADKHQPAGR